MKYCSSSTTRQSNIRIACDNKKQEIGQSIHNASIKSSITNIIAQYTTNALCKIYDINYLKIHDKQHFFLNQKQVQECTLEK